MNAQSSYEGVIGLEVHIQLSTATKAFSPDANRFGAPPNTNISPVSLGLPGSLPKLNGKIPEYAVRLGIATRSEFATGIRFDRKNYFYADLPKGYQITQHAEPLCKGGYISIGTGGREKKVRLTSIHIEEDAGKSLHDRADRASGIDLNRAGVPLLEIVSEPVLSSGTEAYQYLSEIRKLVRYLDICDGDMEKGSIRCDANVSVKQASESSLGTRTEIKNLNSMNFVRKAIDHEIGRQTSLKEQGKEVVRQTLRWDESSGRTVPIRSKEEAHDYRYFPEPDLNPVALDTATIARVKRSMPRLPGAWYDLFTGKHGLPDKTALILSEDRETAEYFGQVIEATANVQAAANWMIGPIRKYLNEHNTGITGFVLSPRQIAGLVNLVDEGRINYSIASGFLLEELAGNPDREVGEVIEEKNLEQTGKEEEITVLIRSVLENHPGKVAEYRNGKKGLIGMFMGEVMKASKGTVDPKKANDILRKELDKQTSTT